VKQSTAPSPAVVGHALNEPHLRLVPTPIEAHHEATPGEQLPAPPHSTAEGLEASTAQAVDEAFASFAREFHC